MTRARSVFGLHAGLAGVALATIVAGLAVALTRVDFSSPTASGLIAACRDWVLPDATLAGVLVLALSAGGMAVLALTARSALRQLRASRRFERGLEVTGRLPGRPDVLLLDDAAPAAFCVGLAHPRVYLSTGAAARLSTAERDAVLAHEAHHAQRRDPLRLLVSRSLGDGLFFLPALRRLAERYAALAELAADEAAVRASQGPQALASALLAFDGHPDPSVVGVAPERVDRLLGERPRWELPLFLLTGALATLVVLGAMTLRLSQVTTHASIALPALLAQGCMVAMAVAGALAGAAGMLVGWQRLGRRRR